MSDGDDDSENDERVLDIAAGPDPEPANARDQIEPNVAKLKARARTEKARQTALLNKLKRKLGNASDASSSTASTSVGASSSDATGGSLSWAKQIQDACLTPRFFAKSVRTDPFRPQDNQKVAVERQRSVFSLLRQIVKVLVDLLTPFAKQDGSGQEDVFQIAQVLNVCVMDDTSTRLKGAVVGDNTNAIHSVMNAVHTVHVLYKGDRDDSAQHAESFLIPTPLYCLASQKTEDLYAGYSAYMLLSSGGVGHALKALKCPETICQPARWKAHVVVGDALPTNDAMFKLERRILLAAQEERRLAMRVKCVLHQISLARKMGVLCFDSFWSTCVRLAHLFESFSFKKKLSVALVQVLSAPGGFQRARATLKKRRPQCLFHLVLGAKYM